MNYGIMKIGLGNLLFFTAVIVAACTDAEKGKEKEVMTSPVFADYRVWAEEGKDEVTCLLQFREGDADGTTLLLEEPAKVELDGQVLKADSAKLSGAFYEIIKPLREFKGRHTIIFTDPEKKQHQYEFEFTPFGLLTQMPARIQPRLFTIQLADFPEENTPVHVTLTDTAFATNDVNEITEAINGEIEITPAMLGKLKPGPIVMEIFRESESPLNKTMKGKIWMSYGLRREFELVR